MSPFVAAGLAAVAVTLALAPRPTSGRRSAGGPGGAATSAAARDPRTAGRASDEGTDLLERRRGLVAVLAALAPFLLVGGVVGVAGGLGAGALTWRALRGREPTAVRRRRERMLHDLPAVVDLLAVTLAAGAAPSTALAVVGAAVEGPVVTDLEAAERSLALGRDPARVWRELGERPGLAPLGRAMVRAIESGASVSDALQRLAEDLHAAARLEAETKARAVGVRAAAPLGLCLLPAFVLIGVVPLVGSAVAALLSG